MNRNTLGFPCLAALFALALAACQKTPEPPAAAAPAAAHSEGIEWFQGELPAAFEQAKAEGKPVFLYWGADWCPPCLQLKASVLKRPDFVAKSKLFVPVYLDGDAAGAQRWGEEFKVQGYPTVVILTPDRREITRLSGGMDLERYAEVLDNALADTLPAAELLARLDDPAVMLSVDECRRLALFPWSLEGPDDAAAITALATRLDAAAARCPAELTDERAMLTIAAADIEPNAARVDALTAIVRDRPLAIRVSDALIVPGKALREAIRARGAEVSSAFLSDYSAVMKEAASSHTRAEGDQLSAVSAELIVTKALSADQQVPEAMASAARDRVSAALAATQEPYARAGVVNSASWIYDTLGDIPAAYAMIKAESERSASPYYYYLDLGDLEEQQGRTKEALEWYGRAYETSKGAATRFQWGATYLRALLRLTPDDTARIREVGLSVLGELQGPDQVHGRSKRILERLDDEVAKWATTPERAKIRNELDSHRTQLAAR